MVTILKSDGTGFTTATGASQQKIFYERQLLERARNIIVYNKFGQQTRIPRRGGKTVEFRRFDPLPLATTPLAEGSPGNGRGMTFNKIEATVAIYGDYIKGTDLVDLTSIDPIISTATDLLAEQAADTIDVITREVVTGGTTVLYSKLNNAAAGSAFPTTRAGLYSAGPPEVFASLKLEDLVRAQKTLFVNKARPYNGSMYPMIIGADVWENLMNDQDLHETWNFGARSNLIQGELGNYMGFEFYRTQLAKVVKPGDAGGVAGMNANLSLTCGRNGYGTVALEGMGLSTHTKALGSAGTDDPLDMIWSHGWKASHTAVILNQSWVVRLESSSPD